MRSMERLLLDFADGSPFAATLLDRITAIREVQARRYAESGADVICMGDDVGTQRGMLMSVRMWRTWLKPRLARVIAAGRSRPGPDVLVFYHSDGDVTAIVDDLIEIGVDILNPVQPECMDPVALRQRFGQRLWPLGHDRHAVHVPVRHARRRAPRGADAHRDGRRGRRAVPRADPHDRARGPVREHRRVRGRGEIVRVRRERVARVPRRAARQRTTRSPSLSVSCASIAATRSATVIGPRSGSIPLRFS